MKRRSTILVCIFMVAAAAIAYGWHSSAHEKALADPVNGNPLLPEFEFHREPAARPEDAALALFRGIATESPKHFVQHILLGVCDGPIDTLQKFAECLHESEFVNGEDRFSFYELRKQRKGISYKKPMVVVAMSPFDTSDQRVVALASQMLGTYYGQAFTCVDVSGEGYDGRPYQTRIVVAQVDGSWFAMPRCQSSLAFYEIADSMTPTPLDTK